MTVFVYHASRLHLLVFATPAEAVAHLRQQQGDRADWLYFDAGGQPLRLECVPDGAAFLRPWASCASCTLMQVLPYVKEVSGVAPLDSVAGICRELGWNDLP